jgi:hypothetical protein
MYCSYCGTALTPGLSFCNRCGAELNGSDRGGSKAKEAPQESLVWATAVVTIVGLGGLIGLMAVMKQALHFPDLLIVLFSLLYFLTFLGVDISFIWILLRQKSGWRPAKGFIRRNVPSTNELAGMQPRSLAEPSASVTEHTTRTMDPLQAERSTK